MPTKKTTKKPPAGAQTATNNADFALQPPDGKTAGQIAASDENAPDGQQTPENEALAEAETAPSRKKPDTPLTTAMLQGFDVMRMLGLPHGHAERKLTLQRFPVLNISPANCPVTACKSAARVSDPNEYSLFSVLLHHLRVQHDYNGKQLVEFVCTVESDPNTEKLLRKRAAHLRKLWPVTENAEAANEAQKR